MDSREKAAVAALAMVGALIVYLSACATANAAEHLIRYQNPAGHALTYDRVDVCRAAGCTPHAVACAPGATCSMTADLPVGSSEVWLVARAGTMVSGESNRQTVFVAAPPPPFDPQLCLDTPACRFDADGDGIVGGTDFTAFFGAFGSSWK